MQGIVAGIFVGGASSRMGGRPKGLLRAPSGETLVGRWRDLFGRLAIPALLVGVRPGYEAEGLPILADAEGVSGPLAGLLALLGRAGRADRYAIAVACDMPYVSDALVVRLASAPGAIAVAPRRAGRWEPFLARYDAARALPVIERQAREGKRSLQALLDVLAAEQLPLNEAEAAELRDWDTPEDVR